MPTAQVHFERCEQGLQVVGGEDEQMAAEVWFRIIPENGTEDDAIRDQRAVIKLTAGELFGEDSIEVSFPDLRFPANRQELLKLVQRYYIALLDRTIKIQTGTPNALILMEGNTLFGEGQAPVSYSTEGPGGW